MSQVKVLIIDDSSAVRHLLTDILRSDPAINVVGVAANAVVALQKLRELAPDVVTLDVEMPDVSGLELLVQIRKLEPRLPVIMFSALTQRAAATTLEALALGATDYVTKPAQTGSREASAAHVREQLIPKIKTLGVSKALPARRGMSEPQPLLKRAPARPAGHDESAVDAIVIGSSTGGPNALAVLLAGLPADLPVPVLIAQHMPPVFTQLLAERLTALGSLRVYEAKNGDKPVPGGAWIAPGDYHMRLERSGARRQLSVTLDQSPPENSCRPAVDVLFRSAADACGGRVLAIVLTGMGQDGTKGGEILRKAGAAIIAQDEASSVVWGMPGQVVRAGLAESILPLKDIAADIKRRLHRRQMAVPAAGISSAGVCTWK
jgi:two-component system, chemotaxis family, protein-glutamate methylesterase/glutaminase